MSSKKDNPVASSTRSSKAKEKSTINQKKLSKSNSRSPSSKITSIYTPPKDFYKTDYMKQIIVQVDSKDSFKCLICKDKDTLQRRSVYGHILSSSHEGKTIKDHKYEELVDNKERSGKKLSKKRKRLQYLE